jgi:phospholipase C
MLATAGAVTIGGGVTSWAAQGSARAYGAALPPGTRPDPSKPLGTDTLPQIDHVIIYMQENQSYDHYFGTLAKGDGFTLGPGGIPINTNLDSNGLPVPVFHQVSTCNSISGDHSWNGTHLEINGGAMDGFAKASGHSVMGYYDQTNLPFYRGLTEHFPLCDRWFSSVPGPTYPNRRFLQAATSVGIVATDIHEILATPTAPNGTIWDRLNDHGISWTSYGIDIWDVLLFPTADIPKYLNDTAPHRAYFADFLDHCRAGTLPQVSIISPGAHDQYDEGSRDVQNGEAYSSAIINAVMDGPGWEKSAIFFTWDEHGGGYDHVPPPATVAPDNIAPRIGPSDQQGGFDQLGVRVAGFVISPYAKPGGYVSHVVHDHTSVLKFVETKFNLDAMTYRDANADDLLDCFDFSAKAFADPPQLPAPGIPATGSTCQPQPKPQDYPRGDPIVQTTTTSTTSSTPATSTPTTSNPATTSSTPAPSIAALRSAQPPAVRSGSVGQSPAAQPVSANPTYTG